MAATTPTGSGIWPPPSPSCRAHTLILDGEVCVFDEDLVSQFHLLGEPHPDVVATPPVYMAFDLLYLEGLDLRPRPLADRRWRLEQAIDGSAHVLPARRLPDHGLMAWDVVKQRGYEGLVVKDEQSPYRPGPTRSWVKVKVRHESVFTVGGLLDTPEAVEGVLVGERVGRRLVYRGVVEWGVGRAMVAELLERCPVVKAPPFHDPPRTRRVTWLEPRAKISVTYSELMEDRLRDPVFRGFAEQ